MPTCYSAVRHSIHGPKPVLTVRLACVRRAASVHPEPGSNSPFKCQPVNRLRFDSRVRPVAPIAVSLLGLTDHKEKESRACPCDTLSSTIFKICLSVWSASLRSRYPVLKVRPGRGRRCLRRCAARGSNIRRMRGRGKGADALHGSSTGAGQPSGERAREEAPASRASRRPPAAPGARARRMAAGREGPGRRAGAKMEKRPAAVSAAGRCARRRTSPGGPARPPGRRRHRKAPRWSATSCSPTD